MTLMTLTMNMAVQLDSDICAHFSLDEIIRNKETVRTAIYRSNWRKKPVKFLCPNPNCQSTFTWKRNLVSHLRYQCGQEPRFKCPYCYYMCKVKADVRKHIRTKHRDHNVYVIDIYQ